MRVIIIGGGIAGVSCAEELRKLSLATEITILSEEEMPLYSRLLLPHYIKGLVPRERVFLKTDVWYEEQKITRFNVRAEKIDLKNHFVATSDARELPFDKLVIASGRYTRDVPDYRRGVAYLWNLEDADHLLQLINEQPPLTNIGIYGGGLIACEFLNIFKNFNFNISIAFRGPYFWSRILDGESGGIINQHLLNQGIKVIPEAKFVELRGEDELEGVVTDKGEFEAKILGVGIGLEPNISWLTDSGLKLKTGILVNEKMETNYPDVYAAGDVAEVFDVYSGRNRIMGNWLAAKEQGRIVAKNITGQNAVFNQITVSSMNLLGLDIIFLGDTDRQWADKVESKKNEDSQGVTQIFYKENKVIGATLLNQNQERSRILEMIKTN